VSENPIDITIEIFSAIGTNLGTLSTTLDPGKTTSTGSGSSNPRICKFTFKGGKKKVRATACISSDDRCDGSAVSAQ
jgi:hypothetical protein